MKSKETHLDKQPISMGFLQWITATVVAAITIGLVVMVFMFTTFETKANSKDEKDDIKSSLTRIENKLDQAIMQMHTK